MKSLYHKVFKKQLGPKNAFFKAAITGALVSGLITSTSPIFSESNEKSYVRIYQNESEAQKACENKKIYEISSSSELFGIFNVPLKKKGAFLKTRTIYFQNLDSIEIIKKSNSPIAIQLNLKNMPENDFDNCVKSKYGLRFVAAVILKKKEMLSERLERFEQLKKIEERKALKKKIKTFFMDFIKGAAATGLFYWITISIRNFLFMQDKIAWIVRKGLSKYYKNKGLYNASKLVSKTKIVFNNSVKRSQYDQEKNLIILNKKEIRRYYECKDKRKTLFFCIMRTIYELNNAFVLKDEMMPNIFRNSANLYISYSLTENLLYVREDSLYKESTYSIIGFLIKLIGKDILIKSYLEGNFILILKELEKNGVPSSEINNLLKLIWEKEFPDYKILELLDCLKRLGKYCDAKKNELRDNMDLEKSFLEKYGKLKKWVDFERLPSSIIINNEREKKELFELLKEVLRFGRRSIFYAGFRKI